MMKPMLLILSSLLISTASANDTALGQRLFASSKCLECHSAEVFTRPDRKVKNWQQLEQKVRQCDANLSTNWFDDEIQAVVQYLNSTYYKFPSPAPVSSAIPLFTPPTTTSIAVANTIPTPLTQ